ncbi:MAG TPA: DUF433 domain-containing protein [Nocardioides sp.]|nr:DUF433 domain-containing protein [Nocardioides sp.]HRK44886.1 DUF433 domain-containing protein [Nocardioides sp.]
MDPRFDVPLYTIQEAARHVDMAPSTIRYWVYKKRIVRYVPPRHQGEATLPFISLAEIQFIRGLRKSQLSLRAVTEGIEALREDLGENYLVRDRLAHDGTDILVRLAESDVEWTRARDAQAGIPGAVALGLQTITFDEAGQPERVTLTEYEGADVIIDPRFAFGQPIVESRGVRVEDIAQMFFAGESIEVVSEEFAVDATVVEAIVRVYGRPRVA